MFGGITDRLIPLFAIGTFLTFTLSQAGMVRHWRRERRKGGARHAVALWTNAVGAGVSALVVLVMVVAKFVDGAWIAVLAIPSVIVLLKVVRAYYDALDARMREQGPLDMTGVRTPFVLVVMEDWNRLTDKAIGFALGLSADIMAVHLAHLSGPDGGERHVALLRQWERDVACPARDRFRRPPLRILDAPYRTLHEPLLKLVGEMSAARPGQRIAVLIPELVKQHWYQHVLHGRRARRLRARLLQHGGSQLIVVSVPWHLERPPGSMGDSATSVGAEQPDEPPGQQHDAPRRGRRWQLAEREGLDLNRAAGPLSRVGRPAPVSCRVSRVYQSVGHPRIAAPGGSQCVRLACSLIARSRQASMHPSPEPLPP